MKLEAILEILLIINTLIIINLLYQNNSNIQSDEIKDLKIDKKKVFNKEEEMEDYDSEFYRNGIGPWMDYFLRTCIDINKVL